jgi:hypothetical protein
MNNMINNIMDNCINNSLDKILVNNEKCLINNIKQYLKCKICNNINCDQIDKYEIDDGGCIPYVVYINHFNYNIELYETVLYDKDEEIKNIDFLEKNYIKDFEDCYQVRYLRLIKTYRKYKKYFIGKDLFDEKNNGNSILIQLDNNKVIYIGYIIYQFNLKEDEKIQDYISILHGRSLPYIITNKNVYIPYNCKYITVNDLKKIYKSKDITKDRELYRILFYDMPMFENFIEFKKSMIKSVRSSYK